MAHCLNFPEFRSVKGAFGSGAGVKRHRVIVNSKQADVFFFFFGEDPRLCLMTVVSTPAAVGNYPACHEKGNTYPSTLLMRGNKDIFEWPVSLKLSNSNCFFPPQKQETSRQCFPFVF